MEICSRNQYNKTSFVYVWKILPQNGKVYLFTSWIILCFRWLTVKRVCLRYLERKIKRIVWTCTNSCLSICRTSTDSRPHTSYVKTYSTVVLKAVLNWTLPMPMRCYRMLWHAWRLRKSSWHPWSPSKKVHKLHNMSIKTYILALDGFSSFFSPEMALVSQLDILKCNLAWLLWMKQCFLLQKSVNLLGLFRNSL